jgi:predicted RNase H-like nuclease
MSGPERHVAGSVTGVDGCPAGWVAVTLGPSAVTVAVAATLDRLPLARVTGIDMPLGLLGAGWRDADPLARRAELSFAAMAGAPLPDSKHTPAGLAARRDLLARAGITLPVKIAGAAEDDLLDAAAVAWSARRIAAGTAVTLANPGQQADDGSEIAIRYQAGPLQLT